MRVPILLVCVPLISSALHGDALSDADREALLDNLETLHNAADAKVDGRIRVALTAFRNAMGSDDAAIELYLNCMEKVQFEELKRKSADFREWKRQEAEKLSDPGLRLALRHQLRWLILTMEAAADKGNGDKLASEAEQIVETLFQDAEKLRGQEQFLSQDVTSSVFAEAYDIGHLKIENWAMSPVQLDSIYENILLPPLRKPARLAELRMMWMKRIRNQGTRIQSWTGNPEANKGGLTPAEQSPEYNQFVRDTLPKLQWSMELDLFRNGDESAAASRMLAHLEKNIGHASALEWTNELKNLLKTSPPVAPQPTHSNSVSRP